MRGSVRDVDFLPVTMTLERAMRMTIESIPVLCLVAYVTGMGLQAFAVWRYAKDGPHGSPLLSWLVRFWTAGRTPQRCVTDDGLRPLKWATQLCWGAAVVLVLYYFFSPSRPPR